MPIQFVIWFEQKLLIHRSLPVIFVCIYSSKVSQSLTNFTKIMLPCVNVNYLGPSHLAPMKTQLYCLRQQRDTTTRSGKTMDMRPTCLEVRPLTFQLCQYQPTFVENLKKVARNCSYPRQLCIHHTPYAARWHHKDTDQWSLISSRIDHRNSVLYSISATHLLPLQSVLNGAARIITGKRKYDHITATMKYSFRSPSSFCTRDCLGCKSSALQMFWLTTFTGCQSDNR